MSFEVYPNIFAMVCSLFAMIILVRLVPRIGGSFGRMIKMLVAGIFFSVFLHAAAELAEVFGLMPSEVLMPLMGLLLTIGSVTFIAAGVIGLKSLE